MQQPILFSSTNVTLASCQHHKISRLLMSYKLSAGTVKSRSFNEIAADQSIVSIAESFIRTPLHSIFEHGRLQYFKMNIDIRMLLDRSRLEVFSPSLLSTTKVVSVHYNQ